MKSKTSFFNKTIYKKNLTRFVAFPLLYFAFLFISMSCNMLVNRLNMQKSPDAYIQTLKTHQDLYEGVMNGNVPIFVAIYMILVTLAVFSYLYQRRSCNMMHAFPVNRKIMFSTGIASILTLTLLPQLAVTLINTILYLVFGAGSLVWIPWYWMLCMIAYDLCFLGIALFTAMISGQLITNFIFYWIFNFMFMAAEVVIRVLLSFLCFGVYSSDIFRNKLLCMTPSAYLPHHTGIYINDATYRIYHILPEALPTLLVYALVGIGLSGLAYLLYQHKALETCGDFIAVPFMKPVFTLGMTFFASLLATVGIVYALTNLLPENETVFFISITILCLGIGVILYFIIQMLIDRTRHVWKRRYMKYCCIYTGVIFAFLLCVRFDVFGIERQIPTASDVFEVDMTMGETTYALTDADEIADFISIHKEIINEKEELLDYSRHCSEPYGFLDISYHLKDGSSLSRSYRLPDYAGKSEAYQNTCQKLLSLFNDKDAILTHGISKNYAELQAEDVTFYPFDAPDDGSEEKTYTNAQLQNLYEAFVQDIKEGNYKITDLDASAPCYSDSFALVLRSPEPILLDRTKYSFYYTGRSSLSLFTNYVSVTGALSPVSKMAVAEETKEAVAANGDMTAHLYIHPTPDCTHTLQTMIDMGMITNTDDLTLSTAGEVYMFTDE